MKLLAIETSSPRCSVALALDEHIVEHGVEADRAHTQHLLPMAAHLLARHGLAPGDLDGVAFGRGPGPFTGIRLAAAAAQGIALGLQLPVVGVSTLAALALAAFYRCRPERVLAAVDARMGEVYWCTFGFDAEHLITALMDERVDPPERVAMPAAAAPWLGAGSAWRAHRTRLLHLQPSSVQADCLPSAREVAILALAQFEAGRAVCPGEALPVYVRERVAAPKRPAPA